jgi:hypothetical protein
MLWPKVRRPLAISRCPFFRTAQSWLSYTRQSATILSSPMRETRSILSPGERACSSMERNAIPWKPVRFYSSRRIRFIASRTFLPTSSSGWFFTARKGTNQCSKVNPPEPLFTTKRPGRRRNRSCAGAFEGSCASGHCHPTFPNCRRRDTASASDGKRDGCHPANRP